MAVLTTLFLACLPGSVLAQESYKKPPQEVLDVLNAPALPQVGFSADRNTMTLVETERYPPIAELSRPMLRLAGLRISPLTNGPHMPPRVTSLTLVHLKKWDAIKVSLPAKGKAGQPMWSPDSRHIAFTNTLPDGVELWVADADTGRAHRLNTPRLNAVIGQAVEWLGDSKTLLVQVLPEHRGNAPAAPAVPPGPDVQESTGRRAQLRTLQDLLTGPYDETLFDYYATAQLALVDAGSGRTKRFGNTAIFQSVAPSPDGQFFITSQVRHPYSYSQAVGSFPKQVEVWDRAGKVVHTIAAAPAAAEETTAGPGGPAADRARSHQWRPTEPSTLVWIEPQKAEGGARSTRDRVVALKAPFTGTPEEILKWERRITSIQWGERDNLVLVTEGDIARRQSRTFAATLGSAREPKLLWTRNTADRYSDPGAPVTRALPNGFRTVAQSGDFIFLSGTGASPEGDRPFFDRLNVRTAISERLFRSDAESYESFVALASDDGKAFITRRESETDPPNYYIRAVGTPRPLIDMTTFKDPTPLLRAIKKQRVTYKRADGVPCSFTLYLPPGYKEGTRLPTVIWAYPREFADADLAGQVTGSTERFTTISGMSHLFFLLAGYAILDDASMPVVGNIRVANDTFVDQIVSSAKAAIDKAVEMGVTDPDRVGVGGHSYGAFMTANLLAHSDLFRAGIARSGAYNRTLTPFGFQSERRTLWQAPDLYVKMSPFVYANKINEPILLIHGEADNNPGTFPIQTERLFQAISGNGGKVRAVMLPFEAHGYSARESIEHVLYEMLTWFDKYVKNAPPRPKVDAASTTGATNDGG